MTKLPFSAGIQVESVAFPPSVKPPGATNTLFLGGAGVRGMEIEGKFMKLTGVGLYLEEKAIPMLAEKWRGKSGEELQDSVDFFDDIVNGAFEKLLQITTIVPITGKQWSGKVSEYCVGLWKAQGTYTDEDAITIAKFIEVLKDQTFPPGSSILVVVSPSGTVTISFSKDDTIPATEDTVFENKKFGRAIIEMPIGKHGVSPEAKKSLASTLSDVMN
ncbi:hypothetical protein SSX86_016991 [Deinandra increscens subsp. villosa]|uniref:Chalcone-flavonone isomerase family protein n=1 Tax=Deinandra increscens subsp. villosa TaxID=3103831 RepID=A0AAP0GVA4_9ASTR